MTSPPRLQQGQRMHRETNQYYIECEPKSEWDRKEKKKKDSLGTKAGGSGGYEWYCDGKTNSNKKDQ